MKKNKKNCHKSLSGQKLLRIIFCALITTENTITENVITRRKDTIIATRDEDID